MTTGPQAAGGKESRFRRSSQPASSMDGKTASRPATSGLDFHLNLANGRGINPSESSDGLNSSWKGSLFKTILETQRSSSAHPSKMREGVSRIVRLGGKSTYPIGGSSCSLKTILPSWRSAAGEPGISFSNWIVITRLGVNPVGTRIRKTFLPLLMGKWPMDSSPKRTFNLVPVRSSGSLGVSFSRRLSFP